MYHRLTRARDSVLLKYVARVTGTPEPRHRVHAMLCAVVKIISAFIDVCKKRPLC